MLHIPNWASKDGLVTKSLYDRTVSSDNGAAVDEPSAVPVSLATSASTLVESKRKRVHRFRSAPEKLRFVPAFKAVLRG